MFICTLRRKKDSDKVWDWLEAQGCEPLFSSEERGKAQIVFRHELIHPSSDIATVDAYTLPEIDWDQQWEWHGLNYKEGFLHLPSGLKLKPGPGFGDLSHPTTTLLLDFMYDLEGLTIVDVGSGSGILTLTALQQGVKQAIGIDIDPAAIAHSQENAELNELSSKALFLSAEDASSYQWPQGCYTFMNMISSEQDVAWDCYNELWKQTDVLFVSGILAKEKESYLQKMLTKGWAPSEERSDGIWIAFKLVKV